MPIQWQKILRNCRQKHDVTQSYYKMHRSPVDLQMRGKLLDPDNVTS